MPGWLIWAIVALALAVGEIFTPGLFFLGPVALAALASMIVALVGGGAVVQAARESVARRSTARDMSPPVG